MRIIVLTFPFLFLSGNAYSFLPSKKLHGDSRLHVKNSLAPITCYLSLLPTELLKIVWDYKEKETEEAFYNRTRNFPQGYNRMIPAQHSIENSHYSLEFKKSFSLINNVRIALLDKASQKKNDVFKTYLDANSYQKTFIRFCFSTQESKVIVMEESQDNLAATVNVTIVDTKTKISFKKFYSVYHINGSGHYSQALALSDNKQYSNDADLARIYRIGNSHQLILTLFSHDEGTWDKHFKVDLPLKSVKTCAFNKAGDQVIIHDESGNFFQCSARIYSENNTKIIKSEYFKVP